MFKTLGVFVILIALTIVVAAQAQSDPAPEPLPAIDPSLISPVWLEGSFACNCDKTCSAITTCEEAYYQLVTCGCSERDGDNDGIPCEFELCTAGVNPAPVAEDDTYSTDYRTPLNINASNGVLHNDIDYNGDSMSVQLVSNVTHGTLTLNANGSFTYSPDEGFSGTDSFSYRVSDGSGTSTVVTVTITVNPQPFDLELSYPAGTVGDVLGITYTWHPVPESTSYTFYLAPQNNIFKPKFYDSLSASTYCDEETCAVNLTKITPNAWLANDSYEVWMCAASGSGCSNASDWYGPFRFTLHADTPAIVDLLEDSEIPGMTDTTPSEDEMPTFYWSLEGDAGNAAWFQVWYGYVVPMQNSTLYYPIVYDWFERTEICEGELCSLQSPIERLCYDGHYEIYVQSWGPEGFSVGGLKGWAGPKTAQPLCDTPADSP